MDYKRVIDKFRELGLFIQDLEGKKAYPSNMWIDWGYTAEDMHEYGFLHFVHPEDRDKVQNAVDGFHQNRDHFSRIVFRIRDKKGEWHWVLSSSLAVERDGDGRVLQYVGFDHDITGEMEAKARAEKALKEAETLISVNEVINARLDLPHTISAILEQAVRVLSFDSSSVQLLTTAENGSEEMKIVGGIGFPENVDIIGKTFPLASRTPNVYIVKNQKPLTLCSEDLTDYADFFHNVFTDIHCWMGVPLISKERLLGMISFDRLEEKPYSGDDLRLAQAFAGQVAIALDNSQLFEETKKLAITDPLTGCFTRRWMYCELKKECESSLRHKQDLSLILFDIDDFKFVNDTYGHLVGDKVLVRVASLVRTVLRTYDQFCRIGGEEFLIILPQTSVDDGVEVAERIRELVARESSGDILANPVTISLGCAQLRASDKNGIEDLIGRTDRAMYRAKRAGKNRVSKL